jgi:hypothetical protein
MAASAEFLPDQLQDIVTFWTPPGRDTADLIPPKVQRTQLLLASVTVKSMNPPGGAPCLPCTVSRACS